MQQEIDQRYFGNSLIQSIEVFAHVLGKDAVEDYSRSTKKRKGNEQIIYKDLRDRNADLTVYRAVQYNQQEESQQNMINAIISWLQNHQKTLLERSEKDKLQEKCFLKHILTQRCSKPLDFSIHECMKSNLTLIHYVIEAAEKQSEGFINNVLMMVQAIKSNTQSEYINYFAQAVLCQMMQSKKSTISVESSLRSNKVIFINLTGKESISNLENWKRSQEKGDEFVYFSFIKLLMKPNIQQQLEQFETYFQDMQKSVYSQFFMLPYLNFSTKDQPNLLHGNLIKAFFDNIMASRISLQSQNTYIALSLSLSDDIDYDTLGIRYLIRKLSQVANKKLIIHIDIEIEENRADYNMKLTQLMNLCYLSFSEDNIKIEKLIPQDKIESYQLLKSLQIIYRDLKLPSYSQLLFASSTALNTSFEQINQMNNSQVKNKTNKLQSIFYKQNEKRCLIICPKLENNHLLTPYTQIIINYQDEIIILFNDGDFKYLYFLKLEDYHFQNMNNIQEIQFKNLSQILDSNDIQNQIVFYYNSQIYVLYGQCNYQVNMKCIRYNTLTEEQSVLLYNDKERQTQGSFHSKIAIKKLSAEEVQKQIKPRISPTVCIDNSNDKVIKVVLFGGENIETPQIMNLVEYVEIRAQDFITGILDKSYLFKELSFKPYPNQTILTFKLKNDTCYLILPGNDTLRKKGQNHPINFKFRQDAVFIKKTGFDFSISNIPINYFGNRSYDISKVSCNQSNIQLIYQDEQLFVWRAIFTQSMKRESIEKLKIDYQQKWDPIQNDNQLTAETIRQESLFNDQTHEAEMILAYLIQNGADDNQIKDQFNNIIEYTQKKRHKYSIQDDDQIITTINLKINKGKLCNLDGQPMGKKHQMQEETSKIKNIQSKNQSIYDQELVFYQDALEKYDGDINQLYCVAFENYLYFDQMTKQLSVKQFTYLLGDALPLPQIDILNGIESKNLEKSAT